ncbi:MAG: hypothetical protein IKX20_09735 [Paludibacteraceae bacterium]|nr:hypothetical protein [Paludibacteraceae bacterium]
MSYYNQNDGCLTILALPLIAAWYIIKFVIAICACALVIPFRFIWLFITIPMKLFTGEDHSNDWGDGDFISSMWRVFFPD